MRAQVLGYDKGMAVLRFTPVQVWLPVHRLWSDVWEARCLSAYALTR